jgi:hypothetical protein
VSLIGKVDRWEQLAIYPHFYAPILIAIQQFFLLVVAQALLSTIFFLPLLVLSFYNLYRTVEAGKFVMETSHYIFPYILLVSNITESQFIGVYLLTQLALFFGHLYSVIYFGLKSQQEPVELKVQS